MLWIRVTESSYVFWLLLILSLAIHNILDISFVRHFFIVEVPITFGFGDLLKDLLSRLIQVHGVRLGS